jgi:hypothetical protein
VDVRVGWENAGRVGGGLEILSWLLRPEFLFIFVWAIKLMTLCLPNKLAGPNHRTNEKWAVVGRGGRGGAGRVGRARTFRQSEQHARPGEKNRLSLDRLQLCVWMG